MPDKNRYYAAFALLLLCGFVLFANLSFGASGLSGTVHYLYINVPAQIRGDSYAEVLVTLTDQLGNTITGIPYGGPGVPESFYIESISDSSGNAVAFSVNGSNVTEQDGIYTVPVYIGGGVPDGSAVRIRAAYAGPDNEPYSALSADYQDDMAADPATYDEVPDDGADNEPYSASSPDHLDDMAADSATYDEMPDDGAGSDPDFASSPDHQDDMATDPATYDEVPDGADNDPDAASSLDLTADPATFDEVPVGPDNEHLFASSLDLQVYTSALTTYGGSPDGSLAGYLSLQADKVVVKEGSTLNCDIKITNHAGQAISNLGVVDFSLLRVVNQDGIAHSLTIDSVENLLYGRYRVSLNITGVTAGDLLYIGLGISVQGHILDACTTVLVGTSESAGPPNPFFANPYLVGQDVFGPETSGLTLSSTIINGQNDITLCGVFDESQTGNADLLPGEYFIGTPGAGGSGYVITMEPGQNRAGFSVVIPKALLNPLPNGGHTVYVRGRDIAGNWGTLTPVSFVMDKSMITSELTAPASGVFIRGGNYNVTGRVHNTGGTIIQTVEVSVDNGPWQATINTGINYSEWRFPLNTTNLFDGVHNIRSRAKTNSGYTEVPGLGTFFIVDNTPPQAVITSPINSMVIGGLYQVRGIASDTNLQGWNLEYGAGSSPAAWQPLASGTENRNGLTAVHRFTPDFLGGNFTNTQVIDPGTIRPVSLNQDNLARDKFIYAHNSANTKTELLLNNGVTEPSGTGWVDTTTNANINLWAIIDLEEVQAITAFTIRAAGTATLRDYTVSVSNTGAFAGEQVTVATVTDNTLQTVTNTLATPVQARFVRFHFTRKSSTSILAFQELEVWGAASMTTAEYISKVIDAGAVFPWNGFRQELSSPAGTKAVTRLRAGNTPVPDETWTEWSRAYEGGFENSEVGSSRYLQYKVEFEFNSASFPEFYAIEFYAGEHMTNWDLSGFSDGSYSLRLRVTDKAGSLQEQIVSFHIDNSPGWVNITDPLPNQIMPGIYEVKGQYGSLAGARHIELVVNGSETYRAQITDSQNWRFLLNADSLPNDSIVTLKAVMVNRNNLIAESAVRTAVVHNLKPVAALILDENSYHRQTINVSGTALPLERPLASYRLEVGRGYKPYAWTLLSQGTTGVGNGVLGSLNTTSYLPNVAHTVRLTVQDDLGNVAVAGKRVFFDNTNPSITLMSTPSFTSDGRLTGQIRVWDLQAFNYWEIRTGFRGNTYNAGTVTTDVLLGTGTQTTSSTDSNNRHTFGPFAFDIYPGWWTVTARAFDRAGNTASHLNAFNLYWDPLPPTAIIHTPAASQAFKVGDVMDIRVTADDDNFVQSSNLTRINPAGSATSIWNGPANTKYFNHLAQSQTITDAGYAEGTHQLRLRVVDRGNRTTDHTIPFIVDKTAPQGFITSHNDGDLVPGVFEISGRAFDKHSGVAIVQYSTNGVVWHDATGTEDFSAIVDLSGVADMSEHNIKLRVIDRAGHVYSDPYGVTVIVSPLMPYVTDVYPANGSIGNDATVEVKVYFNKPVDEMSVRRGFRVHDSLDQPVKGIVKTGQDGGLHFASFTPLNPLVAGGYVAKVDTIVEDVVGNRLVETVAWNFDVKDLVAVISAPVRNSIIGGVVPVRGIAYSAGIKEYTLDAASAADPENWLEIAKEQGKNVYGQSFLHQSGEDFQGGIPVNLRLAEDGLRLLDTSIYRNNKSHFHYERFTGPANKGNVLAGKPFTFSHAPQFLSPTLSEFYHWDYSTFLTNLRDSSNYYAQYDLDAFAVPLGEEFRVEYIVDAEREVMLSHLMLMFWGNYQFQPDSVIFYTSEDGEEWVLAGSESKTFPTQNKPNFEANFADRKARYVKVEAIKQYHSSTYRYMLLSRLTSSGFSIDGVTSFAHAARHDNGYVEPAATAPEKHYFTMARTGTEEYIIDYSHGNLTAIRLFFWRLSLPSNSNSISVFRWVDGGFEATPSWTYNSTTVQTDYWSPYFETNKLKIVVTVGSLNTATSHGIWLENAELQNLQSPYIISQYYLPDISSLLAYKNYGYSAGQSFTNLFRSSLNGASWSAWSEQLDTLPYGKYVQVRTDFTGPAVYSAKPKLLGQKLMYAPAPGTFTSPVIDAGAEVGWSAISWLGWEDSSIYIRTGNTAVPDGSWTGWSSPILAPTALSGHNARYLQYRLETSNTIRLYSEVKLDTSPEPLGSWDTTLLPDGPALLRLRVANLANEEVTAQVPVSVDNTPPEITVTQPTEGGLAGQNTVIAGTITDNLSNVQEAYLKLNNEEPWIPLTLQGGSFSHLWDASYLSDGTETNIRIMATDGAGNTGEVAVNVTVNASPPVTTLATNVLPNANNWYNAHPQITLTASKPASVYYRWTDISVSVAPVSGYTVYDTPLERTDGQFKLWYYSQDSLGNREATKMAEFRVDSIPPAFTSYDPVLVNGHYTNQATFSVVHEPDNIWYCQRSLNSGAWVNMPTYNAAQFRYSWTHGLFNGEYTVKYRLYDLAGNMTETPEVAFFLDRTTPAVPVIVPSVPFNSWVKNSDIIGLQLQVQDAAPPQSGIHNWEVEFAGNAFIVGTETYDTPAYIGDVVVSQTPYASGLTTFIIVRVRDKAMNLRTTSTGRFNFDNLPPRVLITSHDTTKPLYCNAQTIASEISLSGTVADVGSGVDRVEIRYAGEEWIPVDRTGGTWSKTLPLKQVEGSYYIQVRAFDLVGNESRYSRSLNVVVDTRPPTINTLIAKEDKSLGGINLTWKPSRDVESGIDYYLIYRNYNPTPVQIFYLDGLLASGAPFHANVGVDKYMTHNIPHNYQVQAVDKAGNRSALSNIATALYDTNAPTAPGSLVAEAAGYANTINLSWFPSNDNIAIGGYIIERSTDGVTFTELNRTQLGTSVIPRYADRHLAYGTTYWYRVRAFDLSMPYPNISAPSSVVVANTVLDVPVFVTPHGDYDLPGRKDFCAACHSAHASRGGRLMKDEMESIVCYNCHDGHGSKYAIKSEIDYSPTHHRVITPIEPNNLLLCSDCHNPHLSDNDVPGLLRSFDRFGYMRSEGSEYCLACHGDEAFAPNPGGTQSQYLLSTHISTNTQYIEPFGRSGVDCLYCHDNHGSPYFRQTIRNEEEICFDCHDERYNDWVNQTGGWPVWSQFNPNLSVKPRASRHGIEMAGAVVKCTSCHGQRFITSDSFDSEASALGIGSNLSDPFNIKNMFTRQDGDFNDFCLACHRDDPPQAISTADTIVPYSIFFPANAITTSANGWDRVSYKTDGVAHFDKGLTCRDCHHSHGSDYLRLVLLREDSLTQKGMCFSCHDQSRTLGASNVWSDFQKTFKHPLTAGIHTDGKNYRTIPVNQRHSSCMDCHDPHTSTKRQAIPGTPEGAGTQDNVSGVKVISNGPAGTKPIYAFMSSVTLEYELCFKCHSSYAPLPASKPDLALLTNPNNPSYHPIQARAKKNYIREEAFVPGWGLDSFVKCTDCHGSETGGNGIHGSMNQFLLKKRHDVTPAIQVDGVWVPNPQLLCFDCHDGWTYYGRGGDFGVHRASRYKHRYQHGTNCNFCHTTHGSTNYPNLIDTTRVYYENVSDTQGRIMFKPGHCTTHSGGLTYTRAY